MEQSFPLLVAVVTSVLAWAVPGRARGFSGRRWLLAMSRALELIGVSAVLFILNQMVAIIAILTIRTVTDRFLSMYLASDVSILGLSLLQGLFLGCLLEQGD